MFHKIIVITINETGISIIVNISHTLLLLLEKLYGSFQVLVLDNIIYIIQYKHDGIHTSIVQIPFVIIILLSKKIKLISERVGHT